MNLFCTQCGAKNPADANHCSSCGAPIVKSVSSPVSASAAISGQEPTIETAAQFDPQQTVRYPEQPLPESKAKKSSPAKVIILLAATAASFFTITLLVILMAVLTSTKNYHKPVDKYLDAIVAADSEDYLRVFPEAFRDYLTDRDYDLDDLQDALDDYVDDRADDLGSRIKPEFTVISETQLTDRQLNTLKDRLNDYYDMPRRDLTEAWKLTVNVTYSGSMDDTTFTVTLFVIRYDGKWYISPEHFSDFYYFR